MKIQKWGHLFIFLSIIASLVSSQKPTKSQYYENAGRHIINSWSGKCLDVGEVSEINLSSSLQLWDCDRDSNRNQKWI